MYYHWNFAVHLEADGLLTDQLFKFYSIQLFALSFFFPGCRDGVALVLISLFLRFATQIPLPVEMTVKGIKFLLSFYVEPLQIHSY